MTTLVPTSVIHQLLHQRAVKMYEYMRDHETKEKRKILAVLKKAPHDRVMFPYFAGMNVDEYCATHIICEALHTRKRKTPK
jgi:hypothetical protein